MDLNCFENLDADVNIWGDHWREQLAAIGVTVVEGFDRNSGPASISTSPGDFLSICTATGQKVAFLYRYESNVDRWVEAIIAKEVGEEDDDLAGLIQSFRGEFAAIVDRAKAQCPTHFDAEFFVWHQGGTVSTGVRSVAHDNLTDALEAFCENVDERREAAKAAQRATVVLEMQRIAGELKVDPKFQAIRGKRKRCVYVEEKYGDCFGKAKGRRRPDPYSEYMNADIVNLVERVSDEIDVKRNED